MASAATPPACHAPTAMSRTTASRPPWPPISLLRLIGIRGQSTNARAGSPRPAVFPQPDVNRMPQEVVGGPGQIVISATSFGWTQWTSYAGNWVTV